MENNLKPLKNTINVESSGTVATPKDKSSVDESEHGAYQLYPVRWAICVFFTSSIVASGLGMVGFSAITTDIADIYGVSGLVTTMLVLPFIILFIPCIFPANYLIDAYGIRIPVYVASVTLIIGAWIRLFVNVNFLFVVAGQVIMALGQPFMLSAPAKLAAVWFGDGEKVLATTLGSLAAPMGAVTGFLLPLPFRMQNAYKSDVGEQRFFQYILVQNIIITLLGTPIIFLIKNAPPTPPSKSAQKALKTMKTGQLQSISKLLKDIDFIMLTLSFSFIYSIYTTLGACIGQLSDQFGYKSYANSIFGTVYIVGGLFGSFAHAVLLDKYSKYKLQYMGIGIACIIAMGAVTAVIGSHSILLSSVFITILGIAQLPIIGVAYSFCSELTYPVNEALSCGILQLFGSVVASILTFAVSYLLTNEHKYPACFLMIGSVTLGCFFQIFVRERLRRRRAGLKSGSFSFHAGNTNFVTPAGQGLMLDVKATSEEESPLVFQSSSKDGLID